MPARLQHETENIYRLDVSGILRKAELDEAQDVLTADIGWIPGGKVRLLVVLDTFDGWDGLSNWSDLTFFARYGDSIERIAIVGDPRWRDHALMFAAADLRRAPVEYFLPDALSDARAWLSG
jgi:stage II sporulation SpoAA-like protein